MLGLLHVLSRRVITAHGHIFGWYTITKSPNGYTPRCRSNAIKLDYNKLKAPGNGLTVERFFASQNY